MITIGFTGESGGTMKEKSDYLINVPSSNTPRIQEAHMLIGHIICQLVEELYFSA
jgi:D-sedoheptulose 7-phosphate isomerase